MIFHVLMKKVMQGYIAIDIEFTGSGKDDVIFAYGQADSSITIRDECNAKSVCLNLFKPKDTTWEEYWIEKNWDPDTFKFWNTCIDILDFLQDPSKVHLVDTQEEFVETINDLLIEAEERYSKSIILSDTLLVDTPFVSNLLTMFGHRGLHQTRQGKYRYGLEVSSFITGALNCTPEDADYKSVKDFKQSDENSTMTTVHNHDPKEDAKNILHLFFKTLSFVGK
ncbi:hypothetical protein SAGO17_0012 [Mimivirus AB-566-O17]|uniref:Uncharacterized protein n=1 Tax=Mimivirus AB-566-O17 TaxID=1988039 RepID=A0A1X9VNM9_9VIRU|nr:hypothetical protein SAGO17_0012 [Mimivirus AB-566-O17]